MKFRTIGFVGYKGIDEYNEDAVFFFDVFSLLLFIAIVGTLNKYLTILLLLIFSINIMSLVTSIFARKDRGFSL